MVRGQQLLLSERKGAPRRMTVNRSVFVFPFKWASWRGFWGNVGWFFRGFRYGWARATRGYCEMDIWECGDSLIEQMVAMLIEYRNTVRQWPDRYFETFESWIAYLDEIIDLLEYSLKDRDEMNDYFEEWDAFCALSAEEKREVKSPLERYLEEDKTLHGAQRAARRKALNLFADYADEIWR